MIHALAYVLFILPFSAWLGSELNRKTNLKDNWSWILGAVILGLIGSVVYNAYPSRFGNFLLHASGGASTTCLFIYLFKTLRLRLNWRLKLLALFAFVCTLGVLNELAEYFFEFLGLGPFSFDSHDTWRDLAANTTGAFTVWLLYSVWERVSRSE